MRVSWKSICAPTDFSAAARPAFELAVRLAADYGAELFLVHVQELPTYAYFTTPLPQALFDELESHARNQLLAWRAEAEKLGATRIQIALLQGLPFEAIVQFAREERADLLVMGTHGRTALKRVLIGSVAERVVRHADCPVITVRPPELREHGR